MTRQTQYIAAFFLCLLCLTPSAKAQELLDHASQYSACMKLAQFNPSEGFEAASSWANMGGGSPALHCQAVALIGLGHPGEAAHRLELLAQTMHEGAGLKAGVLAQAAQAWNMVGELARANAALTIAIKLQPDNADLMIDRAVTLGAAANYWEAVDDLNRAIELEPNSAIAYTYRASAYRYLEATGLAADDVARALELNPQLPEAYLERGIQSRLKGDFQAARKDWVKVVDLAEGFPVADTARANMQKMELEDPSSGQ